jgi:hypothetical protein
MAKMCSKMAKKSSPYLLEELLGPHFEIILGRLCHGLVTAQVRELILMGCSAITI